MGVTTRAGLVSRWTPRWSPGACRRPRAAWGLVQRQPRRVLRLLGGYVGAWNPPSLAARAAATPTPGCVAPWTRVDPKTLLTRSNVWI